MNLYPWIHTTFKVLALWAGAQTALTHLSQMLAIDFSVYAWMSLLIPLLLMVFLSNNHQVSSDERILPPSAFGILLLAAALCGAVATFVNRPGIDDFLYVPDAVWHLQHPEAAMDFSSYYLYSDTEPFRLYAYDTASAFELSQAVVAYFLGVGYLWIYHLGVPVLASIAFPFIYYLLLSRFRCQPRAASLAVLLVVCLILLMGDTHRTPGNFSFTRMFQGKTVFLIDGLPLMAWFCLEYFHRRSPRDLVAIAALGAGLAGLTASAFVMLPAFCLILYLAWQASAEPRLSFRQTLYFGASMGYVGACALLFALFAVPNLGSNSAVNEGWPATFLGHAAFLFNPQWPATPVLWVLSSFAALSFTRGWERRFIGIWTMGCLILFLNPLVSPFIIQYVTSPNIYWRLFYLLPFPLVLAIALAKALERFKSPKARDISVAIAAISLMLLHFLPLTGSAYRHPAVAGWGAPGFKIQPHTLAQARWIQKAAPSGLMLAPGELAGVLSMLDSRFPQLRVSEATLKMLLNREGRREEAEYRIRASEYANGFLAFSTEFEWVVERYSALTSIVISASALDDRTQRVLTRAGFWVLDRRAPYVLYVRSGRT